MQGKIHDKDNKHNTFPRGGVVNASNNWVQWGKPREEWGGILETLMAATAIRENVYPNKLWWNISSQLIFSIIKFVFLP